MTESTTRPTFGSAVVYQDARSAIEWLEKAFGFETSMVVAGDDGKIAHSEMRFGNGYIMVADEWRQEVKSPKSLGGTNTQTIHVQLEAGIDAHCERARAAGARITQEPEDQFYGDRTYHAMTRKDICGPSARPSGR